ncbi:MAG TPA: hypothetical protein VN660_07295 [Steroidobacteraceae bacterium]|nr:hypothetical protein [Steroidobacteraceae bacterium]
MAEEFVAYSLAHHPAPYRHRISTALWLTSVFGAPIAAGLDLMTDYSLVGHACYPGMEPLASPMAGFGWVWAGVLAIHLAGIVLSISASLLSYRMWRLTGPEEGHAHQLMEKGEGRTRFLGIIGMAFGAMFFLICSTETIAMGLVRLCVY